MDTGDLNVFKAGSWFSAKKGDGKIVRDIVATVKGKDQLKREFMYIRHQFTFQIKWSTHYGKGEKGLFPTMRIIWLAFLPEGSKNQW